MVPETCKDFVWSLKSCLKSACDELQKNLAKECAPGISNLNLKSTAGRHYRIPSTQLETPRGMFFWFKGGAFASRAMGLGLGVQHTSAGSRLAIAIKQSPPSDSPPPMNQQIFQSVVGYRIWGIFAVRGGGFIVKGRALPKAFEKTESKLDFLFQVQLFGDLGASRSLGLRV